MKFGGPLFEKYTCPDEWISAVRHAGYTSAYCPVEPGVSRESIQAYAGAAHDAGIVIAEVGAWSNPLAPDDTVRTDAVEKCKNSLQLAEEIGARCCVNIAGSRGEKWDGPCRDDLTGETFQMIVETVRHIIDAVNPSRSFYALETMPWMYPDSADSYLRLIKAIDRKGFAVHLDPVNLINCPQRYFQNGALLKEYFSKLGPYIKSCHAKDIILRDTLTVHLDEVRPGLGGLDYAIYLHELDRLDKDIPLMLEHLPDEMEYNAAAAHIRSLASSEEISLG